MVKLLVVRATAFAGVGLRRYARVGLTRLTGLAQVNMVQNSRETTIIPAPFV